MSKEAISLCDGLLTKDPKKRMGENHFRGHHFFKSIDWSLLEMRKIKPPYKPVIKSDKDASNFDKQFTSQALQLTPPDESFIKNLDQTDFEGFDCFNQDLAFS